MNTSEALTRARHVFAAVTNDNGDVQRTYDAAKAVVKLLQPFVTDYEDEEEPLEVPSGLTPGQYDE